MDRSRNGVVQRVCVAVLLFIMMTATGADGQTTPVSYSIAFTDSLIEMDVRNDNEECTVFRIENQGSNNIDVDGDVTGHPDYVNMTNGSFSVIVNSGQTKELDICFNAGEKVTNGDYQIDAQTVGSESGTGLNPQTKYASMTLRIAGGNERPSAFISNETSRHESYVYGLDLNLSGYGNDTDGEIISYEWKTNRAGFLSNLSSYVTDNLTLGTHTLYFRVMDNNNSWSYFKSFSLSIYAVPIADAGSDLTVDVNYSVAFMGHGSDEDGDVVLYEWDFDGDGSYDWSAEDYGFASYNYENEGKYTAVLRVTDNGGNTGTDSINVTVKKLINIDDEGYVKVDDSEGIPAPSFFPAFASLVIAAVMLRWKR